MTTDTPSTADDRTHHSSEADHRLSSNRPKPARSGARAALAEWAAAAFVLIGCAAATAGVMAIVLNKAVALALVVAGTAAIVVGATAWTVIVKRRNPRPRAAKHEL